MNSEFLKIMEDLYGEKESSLIWPTLCDKVKAAFLGGKDYSIRFKENVRDIKIGENDGK